MGISHTAYRLKVLQQAKNQCGPDVPLGQFWLRHIQNLCDNGAKTQPRQNTGEIDGVNVAVDWNHCLVLNYGY